MGNDGRILKRPGTAVNDQLFWRHGHDANAPIFDHALDLHVMEHGQLGRWLAGGSCLRVHLVNRLLGDGRVRVGHNNLDLGIFLGQYLQGLVIQARILLNSDLFFLFPPVLGNAAFPDQCVFEDRISGHKPVVVRVEDQVCIVGGLLRAHLILWAARHVLDRVLSAEKHPHEAWHHGADSVSHLHGNDLGAPLFLIAKGVTTVILGPLGPDGTQVGVDVADSVLEVRGDDALQLAVIHGLCRHDVGADIEVVDHIGTFFKTTYIDSTALGVRSN